MRTSISGLLISASATCIAEVMTVRLSFDCICLANDNTVVPDAIITESLYSIKDAAFLPILLFSSV